MKKFPALSLLAMACATTPITPARPPAPAPALMLALFDEFAVEPQGFAICKYSPTVPRTAGSRADCNGQNRTVNFQYTSDPTEGGARFRFGLGNEVVSYTAKETVEKGNLVSVAIEKVVYCPDATASTPCETRGTEMVDQLIYIRWWRWVKSKALTTDAGALSTATGG